MLTLASLVDENLITACSDSVNDFDKCGSPAGHLLAKNYAFVYGFGLIDCCHGLTYKDTNHSIL